MIQTIFFDIGNVLLFFDHSQMFEQMSEQLGIPHHTIQEQMRSNGELILYESGRITTQQLIEHFQPHTPHLLSQENLEKAMGGIFIPNEQIFRLVEQLKEKKLRLILISNISEIHSHYIWTNFKIFDIFDDAILSYRVGALKPDLSIFKAALSKAQCAPEECFYVDDILDYVLAARTLGIDAEQYLDLATFERHLRERKII